MGVRPCGSDPILPPRQLLLIHQQIEPPLPDAQANAVAVAHQRQRLRHIELVNIIFASGAWEIGPEQYPKLERLARAMLRILRRNPDEVFLIEGHTDAVGSDVDNLSLSDRRAASVAEVLSETFGVPPENLVTQGYGEQFLKIPTQGPEPLNRRVDVRRITSLMAEQR